MKTNLSIQEKARKLDQENKRKLEKRLFIINMILNIIGLLLPILLIVSVIFYDNGGIFKTVTPYLFYTLIILYIGDVLSMIINDLKERGVKK